jgi:energy-coupling factor transporter transmembrane protein EcfT
MAEAIPQTTTAATGPSVGAALVAAIAISAFTLSIATFELSMADWPSGFVLLVVVPLVALVFFGCIVWSATLLLKIRSGGAKFALPFLICALTLAILTYAPLQQIALQQNFDWHRKSRERIVARIEAGELKPNVSYNKNLIALGDREPNVSAGGNDIVVDETDEGTYVLFLTSRGLKHYFTGFLLVPPGGDPKKFFEFEDKPPSQLVRYDKDWYFVAN